MKQLIRNTRQPIRNVTKSPALRGCPQRRGTCTRVYVRLLANGGQKIRLFVSSFRGAHSRLTRTITQQKMKALVSAHRDRDRKKRDFRGLWISRINAVIRGNKKELNE
ncbi:hypothetical protein VNO78_37294 [Psophocarpus tetragonolobus]|uniref:Large ribosomal subunit protein bL20c n=1 Tax=Psophocarpus tetragonolobus TaxID=3891 RepID=A0AAN9NCP8_PSOTE